MKKIDENLAKAVTEQAIESGRLRKNFNFHQSCDENIQRMLNAPEPGTRLPPHRHINPPEGRVFLSAQG
jgi:cupin fold WbuC family metalloprotein